MGTYEDIEYILPGSYGVCLAKTEKKTYCLARNEEDMKKELRHFSQSKTPEFEESFEEALEYVGKLDRYEVKQIGKDRAKGQGFSVGSSIQSREMNILGEEENAEKEVKQANKYRDRAIEDIEDAIDDTENKDEKKVLQTKLELVEAHKISQSGNAVKYEWSYDTEDLEELADNRYGESFLQEILRGFP